MNADGDRRDSELELIELGPDLREAFLDYCREIRDAGEPFQGENLRRAEGDWEAFIRQRRDMARGRRLAKGLVPQTDYCLMLGPRILGVCRLRHRLNRSSRLLGGHIGYDVRPTERGKGRATRMLGMVLEKARALGLRRVLLTCEKANAASARVIRKNDGVLKDEPLSPRTGNVSQRYWLEL